MNWKQETVKTYDKSAKELADYFRGIGSRKSDIDRALKLAGDPVNPNVLEIGCGDGRDAREIIKRTKNYTGFDISKELIKLAREHVPGAHFEVCDASTYDYSQNLDVVFAFASLLHLDKTEVKKVLRSIHKALRTGGVLYISLKYKPEYAEISKEDRFGKRMFYFYNPKLIEELAGSGYKTVYTGGGFVTAGDTEWFEIALRRV